MTRKDRKYYIASGASEAAVREHLADRDAAHDRISKLMNAVGATLVQYTDYGIHGMKFPDGVTPPTGLTRKRDGFYSPNRKSKAGKEFAAAWKNSGVPGGEEFTRKLFPDLGFPGFGFEYTEEDGKSWVCFASCGVVGDKLVISMPAFVDRVPPDAISMKRSEYYALVEAAEEAKAAGYATTDEGVSWQRAEVA